MFTHLHTHTQYSLLDGAIKIPQLIKKAKLYGMDSIAITDHGNMYGAIEFYQEALKHGIKPIIGCEVYVAEGSRFDKKDRVLYHLVLLAMNNTGYYNLIKLVSLGFSEGFYYKPRVDFELLKKYNEGIIALSGCLKGEIATLIREDKPEDATTVALMYQDIFDKKRFYLELQENGIPEQDKVNAGLAKLGKEMLVPIVATNDTHYLMKEDALAHEVLLCIQTKSELSDPKHLRFTTEEFYLKTKKQMKDSFRYLPEAIENTGEIADRCNVKLDLDKITYPEFEVPVHGHSSYEYLYAKAKKGLSQKATGPEYTKHAERLEKELVAIKSSGYINYFLVVSDFVNYARDKGIAVGPGRGSVVGSMVAYALGITEINPMDYGLLFERFINPDRISPPDIDMDFCKDRRDEVINYIKEKYGRDKVAQITTFGKMKARGVIRDVGRVLGIDLEIVDKIAKLIPFDIHMTLRKALRIEGSLKEMIESSETIKKMFDIAFSLEGLVRHASTHAAGVVISDKPLVGQVPLGRSKDEGLVTQYPMNDLEKVGLIKYDLLGLNALTTINKCSEFISSGFINTNYNLINKGGHIPPFNIKCIPLNDKKTYDLLSGGQTEGVFQLESFGMRSMIKKMKPKNIDDITALLALYRPGPLGSGMADTYIKRRMYKAEINTIIPLKGILEETYGVILYQEQVMQIAVKLAGFTPSESDTLRKAMGKKIPEMMAAQKEKFLSGVSKNATQNGISDSLAKNIFGQIETFAEYGFNKSHSTAYAIISYRTAYLKANYPVEYMCALMACEMNNKDKIARYIKECKIMGIKVLPPDINNSGKGFTVHDGNILFGLGAIDGIGQVALREILDSKDKHGACSSLFDFCLPRNMGKINIKAMTSLITGGAFDPVHKNCKNVLAVLSYVMDTVKKIQKSGQKDVSAEKEVFDFLVE